MSISLLPASFGEESSLETCDVTAQTVSGELITLLGKRLLNFKLLGCQYAHWFYVANRVDMPLLGSNFFQCVGLGVFQSDPCLRPDENARSAGRPSKRGWRDTTMNCLSYFHYPRQSTHSSFRADICSSTKGVQSEPGQGPAGRVLRHLF